MKKKNFTLSKNALLMILLFIMAFVVLPKNVHAAAGKTTREAVKVSYGTTYSQYDITGDGTADKFKVTYTSRSSSSTGSAYCKIYVNNRYMKTFQMLKGGYVWIMAPTSRNVYIAYSFAGYNYNNVMLYKYKNGTLTQAYKYSLGEGALDYAVPYKVTSTGFSVILSMGRHDRMLGLNSTSFLVNYKIKNGQICLASRYAKVYGSYHAGTSRYNFRLSSSPSTTNKSGPSLYKGNKGILTRIYINKNHIPSYEIKTPSGKYGWINYSVYKGRYNSSKYIFSSLY